MDEDLFARDLRARANRVAPTAHIDPAQIVRRGRRQRTTRTVALSLCAVAFLVAGPLVVNALRPPGTVAPATTSTSIPAPTPTPTSARQSMELAVPDLAATLDESAWGDAPYWYVKYATMCQEDNFPEDGFREFDCVVEEWASQSGTSLYVVDGDIAAARPGHDNVNINYWFLNMFRGPLDTVEGAGLAWEATLSLPTDPDELRTTLYALSDGFANPDVGAWYVMYNSWPTSPASTAARLALLQVALELPEATVIPNVVDSVGRAGTAISHRYTSDITLILIVDPSDGTVLEEQLIDTNPAYGFLTTTYLAMGPTTTAPATCDERTGVCYPN
jgi:hypothetical protein